MSDPSGGNFPPDGGGKGSNAADGPKPHVAPTINEQPARATAESLPDDDAWGTASEPPIAGIPVKSAAAYADTAVLPVHDPLRSPPSPTSVPDGPTVVPTGEAGRQPPPTQFEPAPGATAPTALENLPPYGPPVHGDAPSAGPFVTPAAPPFTAAPYAGGGPNYAQATALGPSASRPGGVPKQQLVMLAGVLGGLFLLLGIVVGIVALSRPSPEPVAIEIPSPPAPAATAPPVEPAAPLPVAPPVHPAAPAAPVAPVAHPKPKKDAGANPTSSTSAKPAASTSTPPTSSGGPGGASGGSTGADAGRRGGRKVPH